MQQTQIDGIPVHLADAPGPLTAGLIFGVGRRDESFIKGGLTHLVEHLAMSAVGRTSLDCNASVDLDTTEFTATGPPDRVADFLRAVCHALSDLPLDRLAVEVDVLRTENGSVAGPVSGTALGELYGLTGPGLSDAREPAMLALRGEDVSAWAARWFHRENAALWLTGPVPEGLRLPLPFGARPERRWPDARSLTLPAWVESPVPGSVGLAAETSDDPALGITLGVLQARVEDELRHRRGVTYTVEVDRRAVAPHRRVAVVVADVREGQESVAAHVLWHQLGRLAAEGPTAGELDAEQDQLAAVLDDPRMAVAEVAQYAAHGVLGLPQSSREDVRRRAAALVPDDVRRAAAALRDAALLCVPCNDGACVPAGLPELTKRSADIVAGRTFARRRGSEAPKGAALVVGEDGVSLVLPDERQLTARWPEVIGLVRVGPSEWALASREGFSIPLVAADWRGGEEAVAAVRAAVPVELQVDDDAVTEGERGLLLFRAPASRVAEAVAVSSADADVVGAGEWTAVRPYGGVPLQVVRAGIAGYLGRRTTGLVLWHNHADLEYALLRGTTPVHRHRWGAGAGDSESLARATGADPHRLATLLASAGPPQQVLAELVEVLGLPTEVPDLLAGVEVPTGRTVRGEGALRGLRATIRGDHAPAPGSGSLVDRWAELGRRRPAWYRLLNAAGALTVGLLVWLALGTDAGGGWSVPLVLAVVLGLGCLWEVRPPRRAPAGGRVAEPSVPPRPAAEAPPPRSATDDRAPRTEPGSIR